MPLLARRPRGDLIFVELPCDGAGAHSVMDVAMVDAPHDLRLLLVHLGRAVFCYRVSIRHLASWYSPPFGRPPLAH